VRWLALLLSLLAACSYERERADALGPETEEPGPRHRPGQPCLYCHSTTQGDGRGELMFDLAGTVYKNRSDTSGAPDVEITIENADGTLIRVTSNRAGNFALISEPGLTQPIETDEGIWRVPGPLVFPLHATVRLGGLELHMRNAIQRERSCSVCHATHPGAASNGHIYSVPLPDAGP
jgi:hypothetical protein